ncbi:MAG TPA: zinc-binding alcohol dehydrogenase family protein [Terriglobales bacterium]|nr:zinc-binding alcohol dehydrogenase family protein [Terriglobales bacterium]
MFAAVLRHLGESPRCEPFPDPVAAESEVLVHVHAASLKPVDKMLASGSHYATPKTPSVCGTDGVGHLSSGQRVFFGGCRPPYGAMAERTVVPAAFTFPIPAGVSDELAAALPNPGISAFLALKSRGKLEPGESVLVLGATGIAGRLAVTIAKLLGAARVVAAGRNRQVLDMLRKQGADATIQLDLSPEELREAFVREAGGSGFQVVLDYVWGKPAEAFFSAATRHEFGLIRSETRFVQVGESAGATISLSAAVLRSAPVTIMGTAGVPSREVLVAAFDWVMAHAAEGQLQVETKSVRLTEIETAWVQDPGACRLVVIPSTNGDADRKS